MKRLHVSFNVSNLSNSIQFYSDLFGAKPSVVKDDYAKWMLDDPRVNFVLEHSTESTGLTHAGIQTETIEELDEVFDRMKAAELPYTPEGTTDCCYAKSEKSWTFDPDGMPWEAFFTHHQLEERGNGPIEAVAKAITGNPTGCC